MTTTDIKELDDRIDGLKADLKLYGDEILSIVKAQYDVGLLSPISMQLDMKNDPRNAIFLLNDDLSAIINDKLMIKQQLSKEMMNDVHECESKLSLLDKISKICDLFMNIDTLMSSSDLKAISKALKDVEAILSSLPSHHDMDDVSKGHVCKLLHKEYSMIKERFYARLRRLLDHSVNISIGKIVVHKVISGVIQHEEVLIDDPIRLEDVWMTLESIKRADICINMMISSIWSCIINILYKERKAPQMKCHTSNITSELEYIIKSHDHHHTEDKDDMMMMMSEGTSSCRMPVPSMIECLHHMISFMYTEIFCHMDVLSSYITSSIMTPPHLFLPMIIDTVINAQPKIEAEMISYKKMIDKPMRELEKKLISYHLYKPITNDMMIMMKKHDRRYHMMMHDEPLSSLLDHLEVSYVDMIRHDIINRGRSYILADYHNIMIASGDAVDDDISSAGNIGDPQAILEQSGSYAMQALRFDPCMISLASCRMMKLIHEVLKQLHDTSSSSSTSSSVSSSTSSSIIIQSTRDCLELFLFMIPVRYHDIIYTSCRMGAIFYNDCLYIAHNTTLLSHNYRNNIDPQHHIICYIDMIPRYRAIGEKVLGKHIDDIKASIMSHVKLAHIDPLSSSSKKMMISDDTSSSAAATYHSNNEVAVSMLKQLFNTLHDDWYEVLQQAVYDRIIYHLFNLMLDMFMDPLLSSDCTCVTESAATDISRLFRAVQTIRSIIISDNAANNDDMESKAVMNASWSKFIALTDLLEYSLADIADWLPRKKFSSFTSQQLSNLIKALFEDTPKRQSLLTAIVDISN